MIGYGTEVHAERRGYKLWDVENKKVLYSRDATIFEGFTIAKPVKGINDIIFDLNTGKTPPKRDAVDRFKRLIQQKINNSQHIEKYEAELYRTYGDDMYETGGDFEDTEFRESEEPTPEHPLPPVLPPAPQIASPPPLQKYWRYTDQPSATTEDQLKEIERNASDPANSNRVTRSVFRNKVVERQQRAIDAVKAAYAQAYVAFTAPKSYREAIECPDADDWHQAMECEISQHIANETWVLEPRLEGTTVLTGNWVYTVKHDDQGQPIQAKARYVVHGNRQEKGGTYEMTFAPTPNIETLRMFLTVAAKENHYIRTVDVKTAFLHGKLDHNVYMVQPVGYNDGTHRVCKLQKALYGLRQSPRIWHVLVAEFMESVGFQACPSEPSLYSKEIDGRMLAVVVHVDDFAISYTSERDIIDFEDKLVGIYEIKRCGELKKYLGMSFHRDLEKKIIYVNQADYVEKLFGKFEFGTDTLPVVTPMELNVKYDVAVGAIADKSLYMEKVGSLLYLARCTRPDILTAINILSQYCQHPSDNHMAAVDRIFQYLLKTRDYELALGEISKDKTDLVVYCDASWTGPGGEIEIWLFGLIIWKQYHLDQ